MKMSCPVCHSRDVSAQKGYRYGEFQLFACGSCGLRFIQPLPSAEELTRYYNSVYQLTVPGNREGNTALRHPDTGLVTGIIRDLHPRASSVFEIGCGRGNLLLGLKENGFEVAGFELSHHSSQYARKELGLEVTTGNSPYDVSKTKYDVVIMRHVLEHVRQPGEELKQINMLLHAGGIVIMVTPNFGSLASRLCASGWEWFSPPAHLYYFSRQSLTHLLQLCGFNVVQSFSRRGDARDIYLAVVDSIPRRVVGGRKPAGFWRVDGSKPRPSVYTAIRKRLLIVTSWITEPISRLTYPLLQRRKEWGEELWCIAQKGQH